MYYGVRNQRTVTVSKDHGSLNPRHDLRNHSPDGFEWGYGGSGPAQLALAILADHLRDDELAMDLYMEFKDVVISKLPYEGWELSDADVKNMVKNLSPISLNQAR